MPRLAFLLLLFSAIAARAQYAPQAGIVGSTAIAKSSGQFVAWANYCTLRRGLQQIGNLAGGYASLGDSTAALGAPDGNVVSLGDSGIAVLQFARPITNGPSADFAVFENGFVNSANPEEAFLELAFVEVSSDGINFTRFPATSLTQDTQQLSPSASPSYTNARQINNLAGKYIGNWGTPFDLQELAGTPGLDVNRITHIRIIDAIGSIGPEGSRDAGGRKVNDPFPSPFPSSGFDLDAVGVLHAAPAAVRNVAGTARVTFLPNPADDRIVVKTGEKAAHVLLSDITGRRLAEMTADGESAAFNLCSLQPGTYFITVQNSEGELWRGAFLHY